jgi:tetratricopeptide (TPR) repeat protein
LQDVPDPVETGEVSWEPVGVTEPDPVVPLPGRLAVRPAAGVVGRGAELASLLDAFRRVAAGEGREVALVSGEAGLGKTTVIAETARAVFGQGACVLFGHCEEDVAAPYRLFTEPLGHLVTHVPGKQLAASVGSWGSDLARLVPALASRLPGLVPSTATDAESERFEVFAAVVGLLVEVSKAQPVVLVLEDLQWADRSSLQLLRHLVGSDHAMRLLVLGTHRDTDLSHSHPLVETLADLHRRGGVTRLELAGLEESDVAELMEAAAGHALDDTAVRLARAVHRETDGNPFFVSEVLRHLAETGTIDQDAATGCWGVASMPDAMMLPASVRTVIAARVGRLGRDAERMLSLAAVIGRDFDLDVLALASGMSDDEVLDILDAATAAALVRELTDTAGHYTFAHALIQHTLYEDLGRTRRARTHRRVAEALEDLRGDRPGSRVGELARHWSSVSQPDALAKALDYSRRAGDAALAALAPADALGYYTQALDLSARSDEADPILGIDLAIGLGIAQRQTGDAAFRTTLLDAARRAAAVGDTERLVAAALANNRGMFSATGAIDADRIEILELALDRLPTDHPSRPLVLAKLCSEHIYVSGLERRQALADEAVALAQATGDDATIVRVLNDVTNPVALPQLLEQSLEWSAEALTRAERAGDPVLLFWAAHTRANTVLRAGDVDEMDPCCEIFWSIAERLDQPILNWSGAYMRALRAQLAGNTDEAEAFAKEARRIGTAGGEPDAPIFYASQIAAVRRQRGTWDGRMIPVMEQLIDTLPDLKEQIAAALALDYVDAGRLDDAHHLLDQFAATDFELRADPVTWLHTTIHYAAVALGCRDTTIAARLFARLEPFANQVPTNTVFAFEPVSYYLGELATVVGRYDQADAYFAQSAAFNDRADAKFFAATTNLAWGKLLIARGGPGDTERARHLLTLAHADAAAHGYARVQRQAAEALEHADRS